MAPGSEFSNIQVYAKLQNDLRQIHPKGEHFQPPPPQKPSSEIWRSDRDFQLLFARLHHRAPLPLKFPPSVSRNQSGLIILDGDWDTTYKLVLYGEYND